MYQEGVNPKKISRKILYNGDSMPSIGLGTFGSDRFSGDDIAKAVLGAASVGYRHFDCASVYGNEHLVGESLRKIIKSGIKREELWITSKLWNDSHSGEKVTAACEKSLHDLKLDYLDLYLVHWPFPNHHNQGAEVDSRDPESKPYIHDMYMGTWEKMEKLVKDGLVKNIGTSNMTVRKLDILLRDANIKPTCNQMELHPHFQQQELFNYCTGKGIVPIGYAPIGSPTRPERDKTKEDSIDIEDPVIIEIAKRHDVHPAVVCIKWAVQRGQVPIPFSIYKNEYTSNIEGVAKDPLTEDEMQKIKGIDRNCRLIKGQVFLWPGAKDWRNLWDGE